MKREEKWNEKRECKMYWKKRQCSKLLFGFMVLLSFTTASKKQYTQKYSRSSTLNLALHNILFISPFLLSKWIHSSSLCIHQSWKPADRMTDWPHIYSVRLRDLSPCLKFEKRWLQVYHWLFLCFRRVIFLVHRANIFQCDVAHL